MPSRIALKRSDLGSGVVSGGGAGLSLEAPLSSVSGEGGLGVCGDGGEGGAGGGGGGGGGAADSSDDIIPITACI